MTNEDWDRLMPYWYRSFKEALIVNAIHFGIVFVYWLMLDACLLYGGPYKVLLIAAVTAVFVFVFAFIGYRFSKNHAKRKGEDVDFPV